MSTCGDDIDMDSEYMSMYYPNVDRIYNQGRLTLVSENFMKWAKSLVTEVNLQINEHKILHRKQTIMKEASRSILGNKSLYSSFKIMITLPGIGERAISRCHFNIVQKTLNVHAGSISRQVNWTLLKNIQYGIQNYIAGINKE